MTLLNVTKYQNDMSVVQSTLLTCNIDIRMVSCVDTFHVILITLRARAFPNIKVFDIEFFNITN